jgi:hypothetical protein
VTRAVVAAVLLGAAVSAPAAATPPPLPLPRCQASAETPSPRTFYTEATGSFTCDSARALVSVEVCLESFAEGLGWETTSCDSSSVTNAASVSATARGCRFGVTLVRSVATGWSSDGETATATSAPVPFYCSPL